VKRRTQTSRMTLGQLLEGIAPLSCDGPFETPISAVAYDSRQVTPGSLFVAIHGEKTDGNRFIFDAVERGAVAIASQLPRPWNTRWQEVFATRDVAPREIPAAVIWLQVSQPRKTLAVCASNFYDNPAATVRIAGITGTNGKTTTCYLVDSILRTAGLATGLLGTIAYRTPAGERAASNTTPESLDLQRFIAEVRDAGGTHLTMEVSSHALALDRVWATPFAAAVFTNLTRDHLDFHQSFDAYFAAKRRLFEGTGCGSPRAAVINADDDFGRKLAVYAARTLTYGLGKDAAITAPEFGLKFSGLEFTARTPAGPVRVNSRLVGRINVFNILAAIGAGLALDVPVAAIEQGIRDLEAVPGRFQSIAAGQPFLVVVDYAHTDDALRNLIETAREINPTGRIITLFGCGGDRDRTKRPLMGEIAGHLSQHVVVTCDNPRSEEPLTIIDEILTGLRKTSTSHVVEPDRSRAIGLALDAARPGDIVLLAGKGHETYQVLRDGTIDFDDREVARAALRARGFGA